MANTYTSIYLHLVFAVKGRDSMINPLWETNFHRYIAGIINAHGHQTIAVGGVSDHVHILLRYNVSELIPTLVRELKKSSGKYINENRLTKCKFYWQSGYACLSYSLSQTDQVKNYIDNQHIHHKGTTLKQEICKILDRAGIQYSEEYLFDDVEDSDTV